MAQLRTSKMLNLILITLSAELKKSSFLYDVTLPVIHVQLKNKREGWLVLKANLGLIPFVLFGFRARIVSESCFICTISIAASKINSKILDWKWIQIYQALLKIALLYRPELLLSTCSSENVVESMWCQVRCIFRILFFWCTFLLQKEIEWRK